MTKRTCGLCGKMHPTDISCVDFNRVSFHLRKQLSEKDKQLTKMTIDRDTWRRRALHEQTQNQLRASKMTETEERARDSFYYDVQNFLDSDDGTHQVIGRCLSYIMKCIEQG